MEKNTSKAYVEPAGLMTGALAPSGESGSSLFVINLCASMAPVQIASKTLPGLENYRLYQVARAEDGRTRHRLRLGFFATELEAEQVLGKVRELYPTAFTACLCEADRRYTRGYVVTAPAPAAPAPKPAIAVVKNHSAKSAPRAAAATTRVPKVVPEANPPKPAAKANPAPGKTSVATGASAKVQPPKTGQAKPQHHSKPASPSVANMAGLDEMSWEPPTLSAKSSPTGAGATAKHTVIAAGTKTQPIIKAEPAKAKAPNAPAAKPAPQTDTAASMRVRALDLTLSDPPPPAPAGTARRPANEPFHVGKGIELPSTQLSLQSDPSPTAKFPAVSAARPATATPVKATPATKLAPAYDIGARHPDLDSTQTIRALTSAELNDEAQEKCFAIQLAASEQPVNLDTMPHLDIFEAYRLYSVAIAGSGKIVHSLRLGFFKEAVSAEAVAGYLKTFFSAPTVLRISVAEQTRFKDATVPKKFDPAAARESATKVVELSDARASRAPVPTVTMEVAAPQKFDTGATGSFKMNNTGSFRTSDTATHRALGGGIKPAAKHAAPATKRSQPLARSKSSTTGKYKMPQKKSLTQALLEEAQEVELSESGIRKLPKNDSLLSRLVDKLKK